MEGWLRKRGAKIRPWRRRYFKFYDGHMRYFEDEKATIMKGEASISLGDYILPVPDDAYGQPNCFELVCANRKYILASDDELTCKKWVQVTRDYISERLSFYLYHNDLTCICSIKDAVEVSDGKKSWVAYNISCDNDAIHWTVQRRYREFLDLNKKLHSKFGSVLKSLCIHAFPSYTIGKASGLEIKRRRAAFEAYLHKMLTIPATATCIDLLTFLGVARNQSNASAGEPFQRELHYKALMPAMRIGDVLLFQTRTLSGQVQRAVTRAEYDHIGVVMRVPIKSRHPASLVILEATNSRGIQVSPLDSVMANAMEAGSRVAHRKLEWTLRHRAIEVKRLKRQYDEILERLEDFLDTNVHKRYSLRSLISGKESETGYFCSQLVAVTYKKMGILSESTKTHECWPGTFAQSAPKGSLPLIGAKLGPETRIRFDEIDIVDAKPMRDSSIQIPSAKPMRDSSIQIPSLRGSKSLQNHNSVRRSKSSLVLGSSSGRLFTKYSTPPMSPKLPLSERWKTGYNMSHSSPGITEKDIKRVKNVPIRERKIRSSENSIAQQAPESPISNHSTKSCASDANIEKRGKQGKGRKSRLGSGKLSSVFGVAEEDVIQALESQNKPVEDGGSMVAQITEEDRDLFGKGPLYSPPPAISLFLPPKHTKGLSGMIRDDHWSAIATAGNSPVDSPRSRRQKQAPQNHTAKNTQNTFEEDSQPGEMTRTCHARSAPLARHRALAFDASQAMRKKSPVATGETQETPAAIVTRIDPNTQLDFKIPCEKEIVSGPLKFVSGPLK